MKIGLLTTSFPRWEGDSAGAFVLGFAKSLVALGHRVEVLAPEPRRRAPVPTWPGIELRWVPYMRPRVLERTFYGSGVPDNLRRDPAAWLGLGPFSVALTVAARRHGTDWDACVSHWAVPCALSAALTRRGRPHLAVIHSADLHALTRLPGGQAMARLVAQGSTALLFVCPPHRNRFLQMMAAGSRASVAQRCHVSPMGINAARPVGHGERDATDKLTVLAMCRLVPIKGIDLAIAAVARDPQLELIVAGAGPERTRLERLARSTGARVRFEGHLSGEEKQRVLSEADVFAVPSRKLRSGRTEGVPTAMLEAMQAGLAVVAADVGGVGSVITDEINGLLVPAGDATALHHALTRLRRDPSLAATLGASATQTGLSHRWDSLGPRLERLLTPANGNHSPAVRDRNSALHAS